MHEAGRRLGAQDLGPRQRRHRARHIRLVEPGHAGDRGQLRALAEHGDRARHGRRVARQAREPQQHRARHRTRADRAHDGGMGGVGLHGVGLERVQQLADEQRVAAGGAVARLPERAVGLAAQPARDEVADGVLAQRAGPDVCGGRVVGDLGQQRRVGRRVAAAHAGGDQHGLTFEPAHEVGEEAQRRAVAPLQVVDLEQQRALGREVERQPVQAVQSGERRVAACRHAVAGGGEHDLRGGRGAGQRRRVGDHALEQLADDAERELALELARARVEHERAVGARAAAELGEQARLADPGRALDQHRAALPHRRLGEQRVQQRDLAVALDERRGRRDRRHPRRLRGLVAQQPLVEGDQRRAGRAAELLAQQDAHVLVDAQRLVDVAAHAQDLHQRGARGLAVGLSRDGGARGLLGFRPGGAAQSRADRRQRLERLGAQIGEPAAERVDPRRLEPRQQPPLGDLGRLARRIPRLLQRASLERPAGAPQLLRRDLPVDLRVVGQHERELRAALQHARAERLAQPGQRRREQRLVGRRRARARPQGLGELVAADRPVAVQREIGEQQPALTSAQRVFEPPSLELDLESTAYLYAGGFPHDHGGQSIRNSGDRAGPRARPEHLHAGGQRRLRGARGAGPVPDTPTSGPSERGGLGARR